METKTFKVPNIGCANCVGKIKQELEQLNGVVQAGGQLETRMITVQWQAPASWTLIREHLESMDYGPEDA